MTPAAFAPAVVATAWLSGRAGLPTNGRIVLLACVVAVWIIAALLVQLFRERRCLFVLDNLEAIMQPGALSGTYRAGYAEYGDLLQALGERGHQSCLLVTSREKPAELRLLEGRTAPVRTLPIAGLDSAACQSILEAKDIVGMAADIASLGQLYGGNPLAMAEGNAVLDVVANDDFLGHVRTIGDRLRECWTGDRAALEFERQSVRLVITTDATGTVRIADVAPGEAGRVGSGVSRAFAERARRAALDPVCAQLPLPAAMRGRTQTFEITFRP